VGRYKFVVIGDRGERRDRFGQVLELEFRVDRAAASGRLSKPTEAPSTGSARPMHRLVGSFGQAREQCGLVVAGQVVHGDRSPGLGGDVPAPRRTL
jgi:hypothetical protein